MIVYFSSISRCVLEVICCKKKSQAPIQASLISRTECFLRFPIFLLHLDLDYNFLKVVNQMIIKHVHTHTHFVFVMIVKLNLLGKKKKKNRFNQFVKFFFFSVLVPIYFFLGPASPTRPHHHPTHEHHQINYY